MITVSPDYRTDFYDAMTAPRDNMDPERPRGLYRMMLRIRAFEEAAEAAQKDGRVTGAIHQSIGQEAIAAGVCANLEPTDLLTSNHRGHGHTLAKGADPTAMMREFASGSWSTTMKSLPRPSTFTKSMIPRDAIVQLVGVRRVHGATESSGSADRVERRFAAAWQAPRWPGSPAAGLLRAICPRR